MRAVLRWVAIAAGVVLVVAGGLGLAAYRKVSGNIRTDTAAEHALAQYAAQRPPSLVRGARTILVLGGARAHRYGAGADPGADVGARAAAAPVPGADSVADARPRAGGEGGADPGPAPGGGPDAAVLLHLSAGRDRAAVVGVPDGLRVAAPRGCPAGGTFGAAAGGGSACAIRAFEALSGVRVDHHLIVDAGGYRAIAAAARGRGGARHAGPLRNLAREARGGGHGLAHPARLYGLLDAATSALTADPGLDSLPALYELAGALRALPPGGLVFRTVPVGANGTPAGPAAGRLFAALRADRPLPDG